MTKVSDLKEIDVAPGVMPTSDATSFDIPCWSDSLHIRFDPTTGRVRKLGGWVGNDFDYGAQIEGITRTVYSASINQKIYTVLGTNENLYSLIGSTLTNITPLQTSSVAAPDSLATHYDTLANDPFTTVNASNDVVISDAEASNYQLNDIYTISGAVTTNGVPDTELNANHRVRAIGTGTVTVRVATAATSSGTGGGGSVIRTSGLITLTDNGHGLADGKRVAIDDAATFGGIPDTDINLEFVIRNVTPNTFDFMTGGTANASASSGGGMSTVYFPQLTPGAENQGLGQGYGAGLYGIGLYGTALVSTQGVSFPRIWFVDRFGENLVMTPGNSGGAYAWTGSNNIAPALITNAPTDINYLFVSDSILVTFGHDVENKIFASDQNDYTVWTASATNSVFEDVIEGAGRLISHCPVDGYNLIYTEQQTYTFKFVGGTAIWQILPLDLNIGIISPMARVSVNGIAYWMGQDNFYMFRGGKPEVMPSNFGTESTILRYVFDDLNYSQRYKCFAGYNEKFDEIWFHYPSANSNECDRIARYSRKLQCWCPDMIDRTAWEWPTTNLSNPRLANVTELYTHESGTDADGQPLDFFAKTKKFYTGTNTGVQVNVIPDSNMTGVIDCTISTYNYPQSQTPMFSKPMAITSTTEIYPIQTNGRLWELQIGGEELGQNFLMGQWMIDDQPGARAK